MSSIADRWREELKKSGYNHHIKEAGGCRKISKPSRTWRKIFKEIGLNLSRPENVSIFEAGCGGGGQLAIFALNGFKCVGLDVSKEVLERAKTYMNEIRNSCDKKIEVDFICDDIIDFSGGDDKFDLVFHVGVLEHFLDDNERFRALKNMFNLVKLGGYLVSIVPSGMHPLREKMKKFGWGGYKVPEIDYDNDSMKKEFENLGGGNIKILPNNIFGCLLLKKSGFVLNVAKKILYCFLQLIPVKLLPSKFAYRHGASLIGIVKKSDMKVVVSVPGRFHLFNLAQQLLKRGYLEQLITSYPKFEVKKYGIPKDMVSSILIKEILFRSWWNLPEFLKNLYNPLYFIHQIFDKLARRSLKKADIVVGSSSVFLETLRKAKKMGAITIVERGSSHILYADEILKEEYRQFSKISELTPQKIIAKELKEYAEADYVSIPSSFVKRSFLEHGIDEKKLIQVPYGVDLSNFRQISKNDDIFRLIFVGGMSLRKGVHYLLQAFSELNLPNSELMLIGSLNDEIKPFFKKYEGSYKYIGHVPQKELYKYYSQGSVFVIMSIEEGLALVIPQAMACGLPVICTTNTGGEDIVRNGVDGFIIPIRNIEALKEKLIYLYKNPEILKTMSQSAKERVRDSFTWDRYGEKIIEAYRRLL